MKIVAQRAGEWYLLHLRGEGLDARGRVFNSRKGELYPEANFQTLLAQGYWEPVDLTAGERAELLEALEDAVPLTAAGATKEATMPYHVENRHDDCPDDRPYAVVKDDDGEVMGCHETAEDAGAQIGAIEADEASLAISEPEPAANGIRWRSVLVIEGEPTDDGRLIDPGALDWRDLPLTLMAMTETSAGGHEGAGVAGRIDRIERVGPELIGEGVFDGGELGADIARLVEEKTLRGVSVDLAIREFELRTPDGAVAEPADALSSDEPLLFAVTDGSIMGATVCPFPAFAGASIEILASGQATEALLELSENRAEARYLAAASVVRLVEEPEELALEEGEQGLADGELVEQLSAIYADAATMAETARGYGWTSQAAAGNTTLFLAIRKDVGASLDALAAQLMALGGTPPQGLSALVELRSFDDGGEAVSIFDMNVTLRSQNEKLVRALSAAHAQAVAADEAGVASVLAERIERHQQWAWQLRSALAV